MKKILVLNGPNLNLLGVREPDVYGKATYQDLIDKIESACETRGVDVDVLQTNHEGVLVDYIQGARGIYDGIVINPAAYTHTSVAILDAAKAVGLPMVEVHISDVSKREDFRQTSYIRVACLSTVAGRGFDGYVDAIDLLLEHLAD